MLLWVCDGQGQGNGRVEDYLLPMEYYWFGLLPEANLTGYLGRSKTAALFFNSGLPNGRPSFLFDRQIPDGMKKPFHDTMIVFLSVAH